MKHFRLTALLLALPATGLCYDGELEPPNADVYLEIQGVRSNYDNLGGDWQNGVRIRLGVQFNEATLGHWKWRAEGGYSQFGEYAEDSRYQYVADASDPYFQAGFTTTVTVDTEQTLRVNGFEVGGRLYDNRFFFVRAGAFIYSWRTSEITTTRASTPGGSPTSEVDRPPRRSDSASGIGPYAGAGVELPLSQDLKLLFEYDHYLVEDEGLGNVAAGLQFNF